ncbi:MBOAT family O-acyltransferase [Autumnicola patrickiae]
MNIVLPVGISFYTFQTLSYTIDVYKRKIPAEKDFIAFSVFVSFFPQLVAGPIERAKSLLSQIKKRKNFKYSQGVSGLRLILWGFFKKIVIADSLAPHVDRIFSNYSNLHGGILFLGVIYFAFQIYCDFSGYSDIAIGTAKLFGINLMVNFRFPYFSRNISEFWRRWHISLTTWFRDYLYIPLGGSKISKINSVRNVFIVFAVSGLWHGANWTFLMWGVTHAVFYLPFFLTKKNSRFSKIVAWERYLPTIKEVLQIITTFFIICLGWIFFRSETISDAFRYIERMVFDFHIPYSYRSGIEYVVIIVILDWLLRKDENGDLSVLDEINRIFRWVIYLFFGFWVMSSFNTYEAPFIYFQF